jgi:hypothetical protein
VDSASEAAARLNAALENDPKLRTGGFCFFGSWEGGRRGENWYTVKSVSAEPGALKLVLDGDRELLIFGPAGLDLWNTAITIRAVEKFLVRYGPDEEREVGPPADWPPHSSDVAFEFGI